MKYSSSITYTYDLANRLTAFNDGANTYTYTYNGLGDRLQQTINYTTTTYAVDIASGLTQVLSDGTNTYLYPSTGSRRIAQQHDSMTEYFLADALGSVLQLTDSSGAVVLARAYDPYGSLVENSAYGGVTTPYGYTGEYTDAASGMMYLRARYYSPAQGRFVSRDVWEGDETKPLSYNSWVYANNNPILYIDPTGYAPSYEYRLAIFKYLSGSVKWDWDQMNVMHTALLDIAQAYADAYNGEVLRRLLDKCGPNTNVLMHPNMRGAGDIFLTLHGGKITIERQKGNGGGQSRGARLIYIYNGATKKYVTAHPRFIVHEMGHSFENALHEALKDKLNIKNAKLGQISLGKQEYKELWYRDCEGAKESNTIYNKYCADYYLEEYGFYGKYGGFAGGKDDWQFNMSQGSENRNEIFADMFIGWVYNRWEINPRTNNWTILGSKRSNFMEENMPGWIYDAIMARNHWIYDESLYDKDPGF